MPKTTMVQIWRRVMKALIDALASAAPMSVPAFAAPANPAPCSPVVTPVVTPSSILARWCYSEQAREPIMRISRLLIGTAASSAKPISTAANWRCGSTRRTRRCACSGWRRAAARETSTNGSPPMPSSRRSVKRLERTTSAVVPPLQMPRTKSNFFALRLELSPTLLPVPTR